MAHRAIQMVPEKKIVLGTHLRKRVKKSDVTRMAVTYRSSGVITPLLVRQVGDLYELILGVHRLLGLREAGATEVPVEIVDRELSAGDIAKLQYIENETRFSLNAMDAARGVCLVMEEFKLSGGETATELGITDTEVSRCRERVNDWSEELQQLVESGKIRVSTGHEIHRITCPEERQEAIRLAIEGQLTRDAASSAAKRKPRTANRTSRKSPGRRAGGTALRGASLGETSNKGVRQVTALTASGTITLSGEDLAPKTVIEMLTSVLARAQELDSAGVDEEAFFKGMAETAKDAA
jgi:ParB/RepB/Spo0J family partition protein